MKNQIAHTSWPGRFSSIGILPVLLAGLVSLQGQPETSGEEGWESLFDGKTMAGWRGFNQPGFPQQGWVVEDGCLKHLKNGGGGDIVTVREYANFDFRWEWRVGPGANSGVKYMVVEARRAPIAHEYQIWDDAGRPVDKESTGAFYDVLAPRNPPLKPSGQFNQSRLLVQGLHVEHWLNGEKVLEYELGSREIEEAVSASKFKDVPGFGVKIQGPILLQDHGGEVWFRNLEVRRLPARESR